MAIRKYKPTTPGRRGSSVSDFAEITRSTPEKSLLAPIHSKGGRKRPRSSDKRVTRVADTSGSYRLVDFKRVDKDGVPAKVAHIEYDPKPYGSDRRCCHYGRTARKRYIIAPKDLQQGDGRRVRVRGADIRPGNNLPLRNIPVGTTVHAVELRPGGGCEARPLGPASASSCSVEREATTRRCACRPVRSGACSSAAARRSVRSATPTSRTSTGARPAACGGRAKRPTVRGVAMNPVDHPHGGGEGKTSGWSPPGEPAGQARRGVRVSKGKESDRLIVRRPLRDPQARLRSLEKMPRSLKKGPVRRRPT